MNIIKANKQAILENVSMYSADALVEYIKNGIVTFKELCEETEGEFSAQARKEVEKNLRDSEEEDWNKAISSNEKSLFEKYLMTYPKGSHREEARNHIDEIQIREEQKVDSAAWEVVDKTDINALMSFCNENPTDIHCREARKLINQLEASVNEFSLDEFVYNLKLLQADSAIDDSVIYSTIAKHVDDHMISTEDIITIVREDNNLLRSSVILRLMKEGYLTRGDLLKAGIDNEFVKFLKYEQHKQQFAIPDKLERINKKSTEVYFWGIPSSGKSCALGAILSVAANGHVARSMQKDNNCQGYGYMTRLSSLFKTAPGTKVSTLPEGTHTTATYEMGFDLEDQEGEIHPLTFIDLAGELVRCMYKFDAKEHMESDEEEALDVLTNVLIDNKSVNRKMHFFVIEYGAEDRKYEGLAQNAYLDGALQYIKRTQILCEATDAVFLMITKVDKIKCEKDQLVQMLKKYVNNHYLGFYNGLKEICKKYEINNGNVEVMPFSLGKVCFQDFCILDEYWSANIIQKILTRSKGFKTGKIQRIFNIGRG